MRPRPPIPTLSEMAVSCQHNAEIAEGMIATLRARMRNMVPSPELQDARLEMSRYLSEYESWSSNLLYYRSRVAREGGGVVPKIGAFGGAVAGPLRRPTDPLPEPDRRLPREREIGDDDVEEAGR